MKFREEEKARLLEGWRESGKSISAYVREQGLVRWTFTKWIKESREADPCFVEVSRHTMLRQGMPPVVQAHVPEILIENGGTRIHIPLAIGVSELRAVMEGLGVAS
jgi:hypothetical protein